MTTENSKKRPPIVVVMGHVDHGKTTLLDYIRKANVATREAGGITQSIGAYEIEHNGKKITFIDTPGHEAFSKMRSAGAEVADLAILVVASEDGVKPQTLEAIQILKDTNTPFIVAINKIDKPEANLEKTKGDLAANGVLLEGYGGSVSYHGISAKTGEGVDELLDLAVLATDMENLTYDPGTQASGFILEARIDRRRGLETVAIVKNGTLKVGQFIGTPTTSGKIKILENFLGEKTPGLEPSAPALIIGLDKLPLVGEKFICGESEEAVNKTRGASEASSETISSEPAEKSDSDEQKMNLILKAGDAGSLAALSALIKSMKSSNRLVLLRASVGDVGDGDIKLAIAASATVIGFKSAIDQGARRLAESNKVKIITSEIVYDLSKSIEDFLNEPQETDILGELKILAVFNQARQDKQLVGGLVAKGILRNKAAFEIERIGQIAGRGRVLNLQQGKKDANQVTESNEAGLIVSSDILINIGDNLIIRK